MGIGLTDLGQVRPEHADGFIHVSASPGAGSRPRVSTQHFRRSVIRLLFRVARQLNLADTDPTLDIALPPRSALRRRPLTDDESALCRSAALRTLTETRQPAAWALGEATARTFIPLTTIGELKSDVHGIVRSLEEDSPIAKSISEGLARSLEDYEKADQVCEDVKKSKGEESAEFKAAQEARGGAFWFLVGRVGEALEYRNAQRMDERVGIGLQTTRLVAYRVWGGVVLVGLLLLAPIASKQSGIDLWTSEAILGGSGSLGAWLAALAVAALGGAGGYLSGLLQARFSRVGLPTYREAILNAGLRPIVGGSISLVLFILLTWQVVPGVTIESAGTYVLVAFLAGFSERYFLQVLKLDSEVPADRGLLGNQTTSPSVGASMSGRQAETKMQSESPAPTLGP